MSYAASLRLRPGAVVAAILANGALLLALERSHANALLLVALPLLFLVGIAFAAHSYLLAFAALAIPMTQHTLNVPIRFGGPAIWLSDVLVGLAIIGWFANRLRTDAPPRTWDRPAALGWPLVMFAGFAVIATMRGHAYWGESVVSQALRLPAYALMAAVVIGLDAKKALKGVTVVFYVCTCWLMLNALYYVATGTSQTEAGQISTGGMRYLGGGTTVQFAVALTLALLNLQLDESVRRRGLHLTIAAFGTFGVVLGFFRSVFLAVAVVLFFLLMIKSVRRPLLSVLPLAVPFLVVLAIAVNQLKPTILPQLVNRATKTNSQDVNVKWRLQADDATIAQFRSSPLLGVGFGEPVFVSTPVYSTAGGYVEYWERQEFGQGAHNMYLWMLAGGGLALLGSFLLLIGVFALDCIRRLRYAVDKHERVLLMWCLAAMVTYMIPQLTGPVWEPPVVIGIWVILLLPGTVPRRDPVAVRERALDRARVGRPVAGRT
jgi:O-antigen ligase